MFSLLGPPRGGGGQQLGSAFLWGEVHAAQSNTSKPAHRWRGPGLPQQLVRFKLRVALLSRRLSPHAVALPAVKNWFTSGISWYLSASRLNPSWRPPPKKKIQPPPYFSNSVGPGERRGPPRGCSRTLEYDEVASGPPS